MRKISVITGTRAEYGLFYPILKEIERSQLLSLHLIATTMHLSPKYGLTYKEIELDGFKIAHKLDTLVEDGLASDNAQTIAKTIHLLSPILLDMKPDVVLLLGDRFETFAAATTALMLNIPIAHIHGGELTFGAVDEQLRHAITKMSHLHFTSTQEYKDNIVQMGEDPQNVIVSGAPGVDNILNSKLLSKEELFNSLGFKVRPFVLFTYHSETLHLQDTKKNILSILQTIKESEYFYIFTYANADEGGNIINEELEKFVQNNPSKAVVVKSLGHLRYLSALKHCLFVMGNSSSGIVEAASFSKPVINIGSRQEGRAQSKNVFNCEIEELKKTIETLPLSLENIENIYGMGNASQIIVKKLETTELSCIKRFKKYEC